MSGEHLRRENWPECLPDGEIDETMVDQYPHHHPDAASVGYHYLGDVCPYCGVPLSREEEVILKDGTRGVFLEINAVSNPTRAYHTDCYSERGSELNRTMEEFA